MSLNFNLLQKNDPDIPILKELHGFPSIKKYISISENYFNYVTSEKHIRYYNLCKMSPASKEAGSILLFSGGYNPPLNSRQRSYPCHVE